ncbi:helix-turn-helix domain-containing protein [Thioclava kandeliae]|uniref:Helix-turn-helix domain-containing protein n=1 Tax=Thioclava kandeliae TaxID=3070818 RepID=A0ABV1SLV2_9RHOB
MPHWNAESFAPQRRFEYWREVLCEAFIALDSRYEHRGAFTAKVSAQGLGNTNICDLITQDHSVLRTRREISRMPKECYFLNMQINGRVNVRHRGRDIVVQPGEFYIVDSGEPYILDYHSHDNNVRTLSYRFPKELMLGSVPGINDALAVSVSGQEATGSMAVDFLLNLSRNAERLAGNAGQGMENMAANLIALSLGTGPEDPAQRSAALGHGLIRSVCLFVDQRLDDSSLDVDMVCRHFRISSRYLHRLFEKEARTFSQEIVWRRLQRSARRLREQLHTPISAIAFDAGFGDLSTFNRHFRKEFGMSPRSYRVHSEHGAPPQG